MKTTQSRQQQKTRNFYLKKGLTKKEFCKRQEREALEFQNEMSFNYFYNIKHLILKAKRRLQNHIRNI